MPRFRFLFAALVPLLCSAALATPVVVGASVGLPRGGITPAALNVSAALATSQDAQLWARGDVTLGLGSRLSPAFGLGLMLTPPDASEDVLRPAVGVGATTVSSPDGTVVRPYGLLGLEARHGNVGLRVESILVFTAQGPYASAALGLTYRFRAGGQP